MKKKANIRQTIDEIPYLPATYHKTRSQSPKPIRRGNKFDCQTLIERALSTEYDFHKIKMEGIARTHEGNLIFRNFHKNLAKKCMKLSEF